MSYITGYTISIYLRTHWWTLLEANTRNEHVILYYSAGYNVSLLKKKKCICTLIGQWHDIDYPLEHDCFQRVCV